MHEIAVFDPPLDFRQLFFSLLRVVMKESPGLLPSFLKFVVVKGFSHNAAKSYCRHFYGVIQIYFPFRKANNPVSPP